MRAAYPEKITVKKQKARILTITDLRNFERSVNRLFEPQALDIKRTDGGVATTNWEIKELKLMVRRINAARKKELTLLKERKLLPDRHKSDFETSLGPKKANIKSMNQRSWDKFVKSVKKQSNPNYQRDSASNRLVGYINGFIKVFGYDEEILSRLAEWDGNKFVYAYLNYPEFIPTFYYDKFTPTEKLKDRISEMMDVVDKEYDERTGSKKK